MPFDELQQLKRKHPRWAREFDKLGSYLAELTRRPGSQQRVVPALAAKAMNVDEERVLLFLRYAHEAGLLRPLYIVYSEDFWVLDEFSSVHTLPERIYSEPDDRELTKEEYLVELQFELVDREPLPARSH